MRAACVSTVSSDVGTYGLPGVRGHRNPLASKSPDRAIGSDTHGNCAWARSSSILTASRRAGVPDVYDSALRGTTQGHAQAWWSRATASRATACWSRHRLRRRLLLRVEGGACSLRADSALARRSTAEWPRREGASRRGGQARADAPADRSVDGHGNRTGRLLLATALRRPSSFAASAPATGSGTTGVRDPDATGRVTLLLS